MASPFASSSYSGFVDQSTRDSSLAWAPPQGSRAFVDSKFSALAPSQLGRVQDSSERVASVYSLTFHTVRPADYGTRARASGLQLLPMHKPQVVVPEVAACFPHYRDEAAALRAVPRAAVDAAIATADWAGAGYILGCELRMCVRDCLGGEPSSHIADLFAGFFHRRGPDKISANELAAAFAALADYIDAELDCQSLASMRAFRATRMRKPKPAPEHAEASATSAASDKTETDSDTEAEFASSVGALRRLLTAGPLGVSPSLYLPQSMQLGTARETKLNSEAVRRGLPAPMPPAGPTTHGTFRLQGPLPMSSYGRDEGLYGSDPCMRPVVEAGVTYQTTKELAAGTTRASKHVPGFLGAIPSTSALEQGQPPSSIRAHAHLSAWTGRVPGTAVFAPGSVVNKKLDSKLYVGVRAPNEAARAQGSVRSFGSAAAT